MAQRKAKAAKGAMGAPGEGMTGFAVLDSKGRLSLSKPVRQALGMHPGSTLAYVVVNGGLLLIPQDEHLAALLDHAAGVLEGAGLTAQDLLDELPAARRGRGGAVRRRVHGRTRPATRGVAREGARQHAR